MSMKFLAEINDNVETLVEGEGKDKKFYVQGLFLEFDSPNKNKRRYSSEMHDPEVKRYIKEKIEDNRAYGELDHPDGPTINLKNASHRIVKLTKEGKNWMGKAILMETPAGNIAKGILDSGGKLGVSSRGLGSLKATDEGYSDVGPDYKILTAADIVSDPSAHGAFVAGIMENCNWFYDESTGSYMAEKADNLKKVLKTLPTREIMEKKAVIFENFLKLLSK